MDWQPIETAPKDGSDILGFAADAVNPAIVVCYWNKDGYFEESYFRELSVELTHWLPLPEPPK